MIRLRFAAAATLALLVPLAGCGKKGPALAPLRYQPQAVNNMTVTQMGDVLTVVADVPVVYADGVPFELERVVLLGLVDTVPIAQPAKEAGEGEGELDRVGEAYAGEQREPLTMPEQPGTDQTDPDPISLPRIEPGEDEPQPSTRADIVDGVLASAELEGALQEEDAVSAVEAGGIDPSEVPDQTAVSAEVEVGSGGEGDESPELTPEQQAAEVERQRRRQRRQQLQRRLKEDGVELIEVPGTGVATARRSDGKLALTLPTPEERGYLMALALRYEGTRKRDDGGLSNVAVLELGPTVAAPEAPGVENLPAGLAIAAGASEEQQIVVFRTLGAAVDTVPPRLQRKPSQLPVMMDTTVADGQRACYRLALLPEPDAPQVLSGLSEATCVVRADVFPPEPPSGLQAFPSGDGILLVWRPSATAEIAGYRVYRKVGGNPRELLTAEPVAELSYLDKGIKPGLPYTYTVTAIDEVEPPNESTATEPITERSLTRSR